MNFRRFLEERKELIREFFSRSFGIVGVALLIFFIVISISAPIVASDALKKWSDVREWQDFPITVPPEWYMRLINKPVFPSIVLEASEYKNENIGGIYNSSAFFEYHNDNDGLPTGFVFYVKYRYSSSFISNMIIYRPDGTAITFKIKEMIQFPISSNVTEYLVRISSDSNEVKKTLYDWLRSNGINPGKDFLHITADHLLFSKLDENILSPSTASPLKGKYRMVVYALSTEPIEIKVFKIVVQGNAYGIMGTDGYRRDIWAGLIWGAPISLLIGILASLLSLVIGLVYGTVSGYYGGKLDEIMMRIVDILISIPVLPILILFLTYFGRTASIWIVIFLISIFGWMGIARVARSNTLQIKEMPFIEATRVAGASNSWIMFKHIMPQMMPYAYASLALGVPSAILTEAGLSFLGLGDPTLPTWGQILNHAQIVAAVQFGYWWLWFPPGLLIAGVSLAFVFIGHALDEVLNPRIRRL